LLRLLRRYLNEETARCIANGVRLEAIGRRDRLPKDLVSLIAETERKTSHGRRLRLRLAIDYSSRHAILQAASSAPATADDFCKALGPDVDLLIRTSGEQRLSDFLLWECAYAEMVFTERMWPDFSAEDLAACIDEFHGRERRFGAVTSLRTA